MLGVLDPAIGGLIFFRMLADRLPGHALCYLGDSAREPYNRKSRDVVREFTLAGAAELVRRGADTIVMTDAGQAACAAAAVADAFQLPVYHPLISAARQAVKCTRCGSIGVIGPQSLLESGCLEKLIRRLSPDARVFSQSAPLIPALVEANRLRKPETAMLLKKYLHPLKTRQVDTLVLGYAHLLPIRDMVQRKIGRRVTLVDPYEHLLETVAVAVAGENDATQEAARTAYLTDDGQPYRNLARFFFGKTLLVEKMKPEKGPV